MSLPAGTSLGSHEILSTVGAGGMGEVYRTRVSEPLYVVTNWTALVGE